jgi:TctA family transporter
MLTLGVPGSGTTAVMLGALMIYSFQPGPQLFVERPELVGGLIASLYIGNVLLLVLNLPLVGIFSRLLTLPNWVLVPGILVLSVVGVYSTHASIMAIILMLASFKARSPSFFGSRQQLLRSFPGCYPADRADSNAHISAVPSAFEPKC